MNTAVLVAEIKHFYDGLKSQRTEQVANEHLAAASNRFLEVTSKTIHKYGGDIIQFLGNSLIAIWLPSNNDGGADEEVYLARKAVQCALDIKNERQKTTVNESEIQIGLGFGECGILHVGGVFKRVEYSLIGDAVSQALRSLKFASSEQSVIISPPLVDIVYPYFKLVDVKITRLLLENEGGHLQLDRENINEKVVEGFSKGQGGIRSKINTLVQRTKIDPEKLKDIQVELKNYIPAAFRPFLKLKRDHSGNEHRRLTIMALNLEMNYDLKDYYSMIFIQKIMTIIQQQVYRMEGSLNKIVAYESGFTVIACWGVSPYSHEDDSARAVYAAFNIQKKINRLAHAVGGGSMEFELPLHIGISTGNTFMGIIGNEGGRKEIVILGEAVERAFLYMQAAMKVYGKIFVDYETKKEASLFIDFTYVEHVEFANKYLNQPIFEPVNPFKAQTLKSQFDILKQLRLHSNPFDLDYDNSFQHTYSTFYSSFDSSIIIKQISEDISLYASEPEHTVWALVIKGDTGSGKSLFTRCIMSWVIKNEEAILQKRKERQIAEAKESYPKQISFQYIVSSCDAELAKRFCGIWIKILREMMSLYSIQKSTKVEFLLNKIIKGSCVEDKVSIIEEIFGIQDLSKIEDQMIILDDPNSFAGVQTYPKDVEEDLIAFLHSFFVEVQTSFSQDLLFFFVLDNTSLMDRASWSLFYNLFTDCPQLILILLIQSQNSAAFRISDHAFEFYSEWIQPNEQEMFNIYEVEALDVYELREMMIDLALDYKTEMVHEISSVTQIISRTNPLKDFTTQSQVTKELNDYYQVNDHFIEVEKDFIEAVILKCQGNPHLCLSLIHQLITNGFLQIRERILLATQKFRNAIKTKCWNEISLPPLALKINCRLIESLFHAHQGHNKLTTDKFVNAFHILKTASVLGEILTKRQIIAISESLTDQALHHDDTLEILKELEERGMIELVYEDGFGDEIYRFQNVFLRETLFQIQMFEGQRRETHKKVISFLQSNILFNWQTDYNFEKEYIMFLQHVMIEHGVDKESELPLKARQSLVIKKINCALAQNTEVLRAGNILVMKAKTKSTYKQRVMVLTQRQLIFYADADGFKQKKQKGAINLDQLAKIVQIAQDDSQDPKLPQVKGKKFVSQVQKHFLFQIQCNEFYKMYKLKQVQKTMIFQAQSVREIEDWIAHIEYMRTKANLDHFEQNFGQFKLQKPLDKANEKKNKRLNSLSGQLAQSFTQKLQRQIVQSQFDKNGAIGLNMLRSGHFRQQSQLTESSKQKKKVLLMNNDYQNSDFQVNDLKNKIKALYTIFNMKFISQITVNACKNKTEQSEVSFDASFGQSMIAGEDGVSSINQISNLLINVKRRLGVSVLGMVDEFKERNSFNDSRIESDDDSPRENLFQKAKTERVDLLPRRGEGESYETDMRRDSFFQNIQDDRRMTGTFNPEMFRQQNDSIANFVNQAQNETLRASMRAQNSFVRIPNKNDINLAIVGEAEKNEGSFHSQTESQYQKRILGIEDREPVYFNKVSLPLKQCRFIEGEEIANFESQKMFPEVISLPFGGQEPLKLKRRKPQIQFSPTKTESISQRQLSQKNLKHKADHSHALTRVLDDRSRLIPSNSLNWLRLQSMKSIDKSPSKNSPKKVILSSDKSIEQLRKIKSVKSKVRFETIKEATELNTNEMMMKINRKEKSQSQKQAPIMRSATKKVYKDSPSISREHSKIIYEPKPLEPIALPERFSDQDFCDVNDSDIMDFQFLTNQENKKLPQVNELMTHSLSRLSKINLLAAAEQLKKAQSLEFTEMYIIDDIQCIVLDNPSIKNIKLEIGTKVFIESAFNDLNILKAKIESKSEQLTVIVPRSCLSIEQPIQNGPNSSILPSNDEDSKLLRKPSEQCLPKALPEFNSFTTLHNSPSQNQLISQVPALIRPKVHPYHKFLRPVAHDSTILAIQDDTDPESTFQEQSSFNSLIQAITKIEFLPQKPEIQQNTIIPEQLHKSATVSGMMKVHMRKALKMQAQNNSGEMGFTSRINNQLQEEQQKRKTSLFTPTSN